MLKAIVTDDFTLQIWEDGVLNYDTGKSPPSRCLRFIYTSRRSSA